MTLYETLTDAMNAMSSQGYTSPEQLTYWLGRIREAAEATLSPPHDLQMKLNEALRAIYKRQVTNGGILVQHQGLSRFTLDRIKPRLYVELDKRIMASANLIKLNREQAVEKTLQRFSGWATSIPVGGSKTVDKVEEKGRMRKALTQLPFEERRVLIDQGAKLTSSINDVIAVDAGAIAAMWHSQWRRAGYNYRCAHKKLDQQVFPVRKCWAIEKGLMSKDGKPYTDEMVRPAELPFCSCYYQYLYNLRSLPDAFITAKGRAELARVREAA